MSLEEFKALPHHITELVFMKESLGRSNSKPKIPVKLNLNHLRDRAAVVFICCNIGQHSCLEILLVNVLTF